MPTRELMSRLVEIQKWDKIPSKSKNGKSLWIYYNAGRTYKKGLFISYQEDRDIKEMCEKYKGNILLRVPGGVYFKKYKGKDKIYIDPETVYIKDMKAMVRGWKKDKPKMKPVKSKKKSTVNKRNKKSSNSKSGGTLLKF